MHLSIQQKKSNSANIQYKSVLSTLLLPGCFEIKISLEAAVYNILIFTVFRSLDISNKGCGSDIREEEKNGSGSDASLKKNLESDPS